MAHFYGSIQSGRGEATRCGGKRSGYKAWAQGWCGRIEVELWVDDDGNDQFRVYHREGPHTTARTHLLAEGMLDVGMRPSKELAMLAAIGRVQDNYHD